ncbi:uncharacterized protein METZ01_LOCUS277333, partial [marine metagenome]
VPNAYVMQFRHLLLDACWRTIKAARFKSIGQGIGVADSGVGPGVQHVRVNLEVTGVMGLSYVHHMRAGIEEQLTKLILRLGVAVCDVDISPQGDLGH